MGGISDLISYNGRCLQQKTHALPDGSLVVLDHDVLDVGSMIGCQQRRVVACRFQAEIQRGVFIVVAHANGLFDEMVWMIVTATEQFLAPQEFLSIETEETFLFNVEIIRGWFV